MLTVKQEKFVQNLVKGMTQREAYKNSYDAKNMKDETIDSKACLLFKEDKIRARYDELIEKSMDKAIMTAKERKKWLTEVIKDIQKEEVKIKLPTGEEEVIGSKNADLNTKIKAMDILNKMSGEYTTKIEGDISVKKLEDIL